MELIRPLTTAHVNADAVRLLEDVLASVRAGAVSSVAVVTVTPLGSINCPASGMQGSELYVGAAVLQSHLLGAMTGATQRPILRA